MNARVTGMGGHQSAAALTTTWLTPPDLLKQLGDFDLDPCAALEQPGWTQCSKEYDVEDNGLKKKWQGRVFLNPPYGQQTWTWLSKLAKHGKGTALIFARTEVKGFHDEVWGKATGLLFLKGRLYFYKPCGTRASANAGAPSVLVAYGNEDAKHLQSIDKLGQYVDMGETP